MLLEINTVNEIRHALKSERLKGKTIGFVPTMGYFHDGHLALMREAKKRADIAVVSLFVNPTQFGPNEDLDRYPRDLVRDKRLAANVGVDYMFAPTVEEMYPDGYATHVSVEGITEVLCGRSRPGHFQGVATVVAKLLNIVQPDVALFGEKDWQQLAVIKKMVRDLNIGVKIVGIPIVREKDGLAMSSRNTYLSPDERKAALVISRSLKLAQDMVDDGEADADSLTSNLRDTIGSEKLVELEYLEVVDPESLVGVKEINDKVLVAIAAKVGKTRLIDNAIIRPKP